MVSCGFTLALCPVDGLEHVLRLSRFLCAPVYVLVEHDFRIPLLVASEAQSRADSVDTDPQVLAVGITNQRTLFRYEGSSGYLCNLSFNVLTLLAIFVDQLGQ